MSPDAIRPCRYCQTTELVCVLHRSVQRKCCPDCTHVQETTNGSSRGGPV